MIAADPYPKRASEEYPPELGMPLEHAKFLENKEFVVWRVSTTGKFTYMDEIKRAFFYYVPTRSVEYLCDIKEIFDVLPVKYYQFMPEFRVKYHGFHPEGCVFLLIEKFYKFKDPKNIKNLSPFLNLKDELVSTSANYTYIQDYGDDDFNAIT